MLFLPTSKACPGKWSLSRNDSEQFQLGSWNLTVTAKHAATRCTAWCSEIGSLTSLDSWNSGASSDAREPFSLHQDIQGSFYEFIGKEWSIFCTTVTRSYEKHRPSLHQGFNRRTTHQQHWFLSIGMGCSRSLLLNSSQTAGATLTHANTSKKKTMLQVCVCVCVCVCVRVCARVCVCVYLSVCLYRN